MAIMPRRGLKIMRPYRVALIQLEEGPMVTAMMTDLDSNKTKRNGKSGATTGVYRSGSGNGN